MSKTYAVADLHGHYDLYKKIKKILKPEDKCYVLGDCGDRGPRGWDLIKATIADPQFIYIKGNHEELLCEAIDGFPHLLFCNGGQKTYEDYINDEYASMYVTTLKTLPVIQKYINKDGYEIILTHAGITPHKDEELEDDTYLWDRSHYIEKWDENFTKSIIVHGHTPTEVLARYLGCKKPKGALRYCRDNKGLLHKIDIDCGTFNSKYTVLLDLDTLEEQIIE